MNAAQPRGGQCGEFWSRVPLVTRVMFLVNLGVYLLTLATETQPFLYPWMLCPVLVYQQHEFSRLVTSAFVHANFLHIAMNMFAYVALGSQVEQTLGSLPMLGVLWLLIGFGNLSYVFAGWISQSFHHIPCAVGFSGVIFGLLMIETQLASAGTRRLLCFDLPGWMYPWFLLFGISLIMPQVSFFGHFFGIIGGWAFSKGFLCCVPARSHLVVFERHNEGVLLANLSRYMGPYIKCPEQSPLRERHLNLNCCLPSFNFNLFESSCVICNGWLTSCQRYLQTTWRRTRSQHMYEYDPVEVVDNQTNECQERPHLAAHNGQFIALHVVDEISSVPQFQAETQDCPSQVCGEIEPGSDEVVPSVPRSNESRLLAPGYLARGKSGALQEKQRREKAKEMTKAVNRRLLGDRKTVHSGRGTGTQPSNSAGSSPQLSTPRDQMSNHRDSPSS
eukprot:gb/GEZN01007003.1/.p1 GENE.gb/GEZN01007003.1/~~gb/GEZN01007003.1/.p1  ORF type:complete len:446 (+),score=19.11 gb/GEZN01007003.1/:40-1377(+)